MFVAFVVVTSLLYYSPNVLSIAYGGNDREFTALYSYIDYT